MDDFVFFEMESLQLVEGLAGEAEVDIHHSAEEGFLFGEDDGLVVVGGILVGEERGEGHLGKVEGFVAHPHLNFVSEFFIGKAVRHPTLQPPHALVCQVETLIDETFANELLTQIQTPGFHSVQLSFSLLEPVPSFKHRAGIGVRQSLNYKSHALINVGFVQIPLIDQFVKPSAHQPRITVHNFSQNPFLAL